MVTETAQSITTKGDGEIKLLTCDVAQCADSAGGICYRVGVGTNHTGSNRWVKTIDEVVELLRNEVERHLS